MGDIGTKPPRPSPGKTRPAVTRDAQDDAHRFVGVAWGRLPADVRVRILELVHGAIAAGTAGPSSR